MPAFTATAPGKIILFGEHAVVYGRPAIAAPVLQARARAVVTPRPQDPPAQVLVEAPDIGLSSRLEELPALHPLRRAVQALLDELRLDHLPACKLRVTSDIPLAAGMGSGAAISVALIRALAAFLGQPLPLEVVSGLAYEVEKIHHGAPSGIDNTVITYGLPVYFHRQPQGPLRIDILHPVAPFTVVIGDTGVSFPTAVAVGDLRQAWQAEPERHERLFDAVGEIAVQARSFMESGQPDELGPLMDENQRLLGEMGISSPELERLIEAARDAGALGAKLSGGGRGGNMIALAPAWSAPKIAAALEAAGAVRTLITRVE
jgi:mevalonate kinase